MRLLPRGIVLVAVILGGPNSVSAAQSQHPTPADTDWTITKPLTGQAVPCKDSRIKIFECQNVELLSFLPRAAIGESAGNDIWGWTDSATGREFVIIGDTATAFVEVTDPVNPKYLGSLPPHQGATKHDAQSVKVYKHYALVGYENSDNGLQVFDLTQLRNVKNPPVVFQETAHYSGITSTHTLAINPETGFAYANGSNTCGGGLHMIDARVPTKPAFAGCYTERRTNGGWIHDTQCVVYRGPDQQYKGRELCFSSSVDALGIADVTDKQHPKTIGIARYPNVVGAHQGWLTEDQRYFFLDDELDESMGSSARNPTRTIVFDVSDLDDPVLLTEYFAKTTNTDHNLYIDGRYMYQSNYKAGLRIIDVADPKHPKEVGYLANAGNAWGAYPFFKKGVVAVSMDTGLFLARLLKQ